MKIKKVNRWDIQIRNIPFSMENKQTYKHKHKIKRKVKTVDIMRKTNSKEVKQAVRKYLLESINFVLEEREIVTDKPCTAYFQIIKEEKFYQTYRNDFDMFEDFHQGLGGFGDDIYYLSSERNHGLKCKDFLQDWLEQTNAEVDKYSNEESSKLMINLCWREFQYLMSKEQ